MRFTNPFCFVVQVTAWIHFSAVSPSSTSDTSKLSCHPNDSAWLRDRRTFTVIPTPFQGFGSTTTSPTAAYMKSWWNPGALSGRVNSTTMRFTNPFCFVVQVTAWIHFSAVSPSSTSDTSKLSCHPNDSAWLRDRRTFTVIPTPFQGFGSTTTSPTAAYMKSWWNPGALSGRVNSTTMRFTNPFCFVVQVTAWIHFSAVSPSSTSDTSKLSCHPNDSAWLRDRRTFTVIPTPFQGFGSTTTSPTAAYMKGWWNPGALSYGMDSLQRRIAIFNK
ncbi:hypothetical protein MTO96_040587 [Rhipicephalus appendiculatus]